MREGGYGIQEPGVMEYKGFPISELSPPRCCFESGDKSCPANIASICPSYAKPGNCPQGKTCVCVVQNVLILCGVIYIIHIHILSFVLQLFYQQGILILHILI